MWLKISRNTVRQSVREGRKMLWHVRNGNLGIVRRRIEKVTGFDSGEVRSRVASSLGKSSVVRSSYHLVTPVAAATRAAAMTLYRDHVVRNPLRHEFGASDSIAPRFPKVSRPDFHSAVILSERTSHSMRYEWAQTSLMPGEWPDQLSGRVPDLLVVEARTAGLNDCWQGKLWGKDGPNRPLRDLLLWCNAKSIPTVYWITQAETNYSHHARYVDRFDHVLTVDRTSIAALRKCSNSARVSFLEVAIQPLIHNPIKLGQERSLVGIASRVPAKIRNKKSTDRQLSILGGGVQDALRRIPEASSFIVPAPGSRIREEDRKYFKNSQGVASDDYLKTLGFLKRMRAAVVIEPFQKRGLLDQNIIETIALGVPLVTSRKPSQLTEEAAIGELGSTQNRRETEGVLREMAKGSDRVDKQMHEMQRRVWADYSYHRRTNELIAIVDSTKSKAIPNLRISVFAEVTSMEQAEYVFEAFSSQTYRNKRLLILAPREVETELATVLPTDRRGIDVVEAKLFGTSIRAKLERLRDDKGQLIGVMDPNCFYGQDFLADIIHAFGYSGAHVVGKAAYYSLDSADDGIHLESSTSEFSYTNRLDPGSAIWRRRYLRVNGAPTKGTASLLESVSWLLGGETKSFSADRFNFCKLKNFNFNEPDTNTAGPILLENIKQVVVA